VRRGVFVLVLGVLVALVAGPAGPAGASVVRASGAMTPAHVVRALAAGDLDRDGRADIVVAYEHMGRRARAHVAVLKGDRGGGFRSVTNLLLPRAVVAMGLADLDSDGRLDVVVALKGQMLFALRGDGKGGLGRFGATVLLPQGVGRVIPGDVDGDGAPDLITSSRWPTPARITILKGDGRGGFQVLSSPVLVGADHSFIQGVATGDFDANGRADVVVARTAGFGNSVPFPIEGRIDVLAGRAGADLAVSASVPIAPPGSQALGGELASGDVDGDGHADVVISWSADHHGGALSVLRGDGSGSLLPATDSSLGAPILDVTAADLNHDGRTDLVFTSECGAAGTAVSTGTAFALRVSTGCSAPSGSPIRPAVGDVNADGNPDFVDADYDGGGIIVYHLNGRGGIRGICVHQLGRDKDHYLAGPAHPSCDDAWAVTHASGLYSGPAG
jgi:hypothetical protein